MLFGWFKSRTIRDGLKHTSALSRQSQLEEARALMSRGLHAAAAVHVESLAERFADDAELHNEL